MNTQPDEPQKGKAPVQPLPPHRPAEEEELVHYDDRVISRAFGWSAVALGLILAVAGGAFFWLTRKPAAAAPKLTRLTAPVGKEVALAEIPDAKFTDITTASGINFVHANGAYGEKLLPE